jgi:Domain of unknown function (DUF4267)
LSINPVVTTPVSRLFLRLLVTGRITLALTTVLAPHRALKLFQIPGDGTPAPALFRMFGIRNGGLGLGLLRLDQFKNPRAFIVLNIVMDVVDGLGFWSAKRRGEFGKAGSTITIGLAGAATVAGAVIYSGTKRTEDQVGAGVRAFVRN